jgi:bifunctional N-acetylglucosamine-1-phosphate-uridyltransferase/glucosamine-1-phosphate-acetyltransferase GlmU-like protein
MYSWLKLKNNNFIKKVFVKKFIFKNPLKEFAIVGTFYFKNKNIFTNAFKSLLRNKRTTNGEYYIDDLINEAIKLKYKVKNFTVDNYVCWGTPNDLRIFQYFQKIFSSVSWHPYNMYKDFMYKKLK